MIFRSQKKRKNSILKKTEQYSVLYSVSYLFLYIDIKIHRKRFEKTVNRMITGITSVERKIEERIWNIQRFSRMHVHVICVFGTKFFTEQLVPGLGKKMYKISLEYTDILDSKKVINDDQGHFKKALAPTNQREAI